MPSRWRRCCPTRMTTTLTGTPRLTSPTSSPPSSRPLPRARLTRRRLMSSLAEWPAPIGGIIHDKPTSMRAEARDLWVAALRSGAYPQGRFQLRSPDNEFCPLGVLADLATMVGVVTWEKLDGIWFLPPWERGNALPPLVQTWAGFKGMHGSQL